MHPLKTIVSAVALALTHAAGVSAGPNTADGMAGPIALPAPVANLNALVAGHSLIDLPPVIPHAFAPVAVAQAGGVPAGLFFDPTQMSPLGDPQWVASLRGADPSTPQIHITRAVTLRGDSQEMSRVPNGVFSGGDATVRNGQILKNGRVFLIGAERSSLAKGATILLAPGRSAELGDIRVPFVRVFVAAPSGKPLDVDALVGRKPNVGMFSALFAPTPARRGEAGGTAIASVTIPAPARLAAQIAAVEERSVVLQALPPAAVEDRVVVAFAAPTEERSVALRDIPPAQVEERYILVQTTPVEDRSVMLSAIPPAAVEDRVLVAFAAPTEERSVALRDIPPARVEERYILVQTTPVEERAVMVGSIPPAKVEERVVVAFAAPTEERSVALRDIPPASVIERGFLAFIVPVEERSELLAAIPPASVEERNPVRVASAVPTMEAPVVAQVAVPLGKPVAGVSPRAELVAAKEIPVASEGLMRVAINPLHASTVVIAAAHTVTPGTSSRNSTQPPVKFSAIQRKIPSVMIDRKGGFFFM